MPLAPQICQSPYATTLSTKRVGLFISSEAPGLVFSATSQRGMLAPSALPRSSVRDLRFPPLIRLEKTAPSR
jgi:hypothetical protein